MSDPIGRIVSDQDLQMNEALPEAQRAKQLGAGEYPFFGFPGWSRNEAANRRRNEHVVTRIGDTLQSGESGLLFMREEHQLQFPPDIQVFYVAPPALDELKRWLREQDEQARRAAATQATAGDKEPATDTAKTAKDDTEKAAKKRKPGGRAKAAPEAKKEKDADA